MILLTIILPVLSYFAGMPVAFALLVASISLIVAEGTIPYIAIPQNMVSGVDSFLMLAVPLFLLAAKIMNAGQITDRLFNFASCLVGHIKGGLAHVNILASLLFAGMSGSAVADASGLGEIEIYAMTSRGFDSLFSGAVTAASSCIGPIFPPSVPFLVYGGLAGVSIAKLFLAGALPGVLMAVLLMGAAYVLSVRRDYPSEKRATLKEVLAAGRLAIFPLLSPAIILGCIVLGVTTPTEASVIAVVYSLILSLYYGTIKWRDIPRILVEVGVEAGCLMFIISSVSLFAWVITFYQIPHMFVEFIFGFTQSPNVIILLTFLVLFVIGLFMNTTPGLIVSMPFLIPLAQQAGINMIQFGVFSVLTLVIGLLTPPVGIVLYIVARQARVDVADLVRELLPFIFVLVIAAFLVGFVPKLTLWLPQLIS